MVCAYEIKAFFQAPLAGSDSWGKAARSLRESGFLIMMPDDDCALCPRLEAFRNQNRCTYPEFYNAPVPSFGSLQAALLIVGLAPGLKGANQTGRPFTGDYAGEVLYPSLLKHELAEEDYARRADDGLTLQGCRITNAVRCVPPQNKPTTAEIRTCSERFLAAEIAAMPHLIAIIALGTIAHTAVVRVLGGKLKDYPFRHGAEHALPSPVREENVTLFDSYHCSRYNINTGKLTQEMFDAVVARAAKSIPR